MQNVPKIVRERLKATTADPSSNHLDAEFLTAFAEHSLPSRERDLVLEHLARCGDCREIVALALPAMEVVEPLKTVVRPAARGWLTWPVLRWGLVAGGVVAIASLGIVQYEHSAATRNLAARSSTPVEVAANQPKQQSLETSLPSVPETQSDKVQSREKSASAAAAAPVDNEKKNESRVRSSYQSLSEPQVNKGTPSLTAEQLPHGPRLANQWQQNVIQNQAPAFSPAPAAKQQAAGDQSAQIAPSPEVVEVESAAAQADTQNKNRDAGKVQDSPPVRQPATEEYALARVGKAKPAVTPEYAGLGTKGGPLPSAMAGTIPTSAPLPTWSISSNGALQRSYDQGATWQLVDVNTTLGAFDALSVQRTAKSSRGDSKDGQTQALKRDSASPTFRAVAANAADVWAGGSRGTLYHSLDAGDHWTRVLPALAGAVLTGDVVSLEFVDAQHGRVSTSTAENWITSDGGQTWRKQ